MRPIISLEEIEKQLVPGSRPNGIPPGVVLLEKSGGAGSKLARLSRGTLDNLQLFFSYFDPPSKDPVPLTIR